ncbi:MAG: PAS domain-containing sensor histidine kinase [Candidatus Bathyarchaeia archaeon]|jgi:PAS domain S-box-containing protein
MVEKAAATGKGKSSGDTTPYHLASSQNIHHGLFLHMNDGFAYCKVIFDQTGNPVDYVFCEANKAFRQITKLCDRSIIGKKTTEVYPWSKTEASEWIEMCGAIAQTGKSAMFEGQCKSLNRWFAVNAYCPEKGYVAMIIKDITGRKKTEHALRQSERQYKKLANSITDPFFALDSCLKFTYWNKASEKSTGIKSSETLGKHFFEVFGRTRATRKATSVYLDVMRTRCPRTIIDKLPKVDSETVFEIEVYPTGNGISVLAKDITERKKQQITMEEYAKRLEELVKARTEKLKNAERLAAIGETAGMIGHDIRNPLQSIIGEVYLAKDELGDLSDSGAKKRLLDSISAIEEQTLYINKIVADLQDFAKPLTPVTVETDLEQIVKTVMLELEMPLNVKAVYSVTKPFPLLKTDPSFIKRILTNLVRNGIQAMEEEGGELSVNAFPRDGSVILAVSDTGAGIPNEVKEKLFKPLFTTKSKGQGFGLPVVKKLVEALDGNVSFETQVGKGTTFVVELPLIRKV